MTEKEREKLADLARRIEAVKSRVDITPATLHFLQAAKPGILALVQEARTQQQEIDRLARLTENTQVTRDKEKAETERLVAQLRESGDLERAKARILLRLFKAAWTAAADGFTLVQSASVLNKKLAKFPEFVTQYGIEIREDLTVLIQSLDAAKASIGAVLDELDRSSKKGLVSDEMIEVITGESKMPLKSVKGKAPEPILVSTLWGSVCCPKCGNTSGPFRVKEERFVEIEQGSVGAQMKRASGDRLCDEQIECPCGAVFSATEGAVSPMPLKKEA